MVVGVVMVFSHTVQKVRREMKKKPYTHAHTHTPMHTPTHTYTKKSENKKFLEAKTIYDLGGCKTTVHVSIWAARAIFKDYEFLCYNKVLCLLVRTTKQINAEGVAGANLILIAWEKL